MAKLKLRYDREGDILEILFDDAPAVTDEIADDLFERRTVDGRVVGFLLLNYSQHDLTNLELPVKVDVVPA
jgi:uncharacterized protein YuzE